jgi:phage baseplate assembly protein W
MAIKRNTKTFSDLNLLFTSNPITKDVTKKIDEEAVKSSIRNLILTRNFERPFHPEIGCQVNNLLFENLTPVVYQVAKKTIFDVIEKFEPRVNVLDVVVSQYPDNNYIVIDVTFRLLNSDRPITLSTLIQRVR